ncbi:MAG: hypothetical protein ACE5F1_22140, partial [Planctomycetota bacterium]
VKEFLLPKPSSIFQALVDEWSTMWRAGWETGKIAVTGLVIGVAAGALLAARQELVEQAPEKPSEQGDPVPVVAQVQPVAVQERGMTECCGRG